MYPVTSISSHFPLSSISKLRPPARLLIASPAIAQETRKSCWNLRARTFSYIPHLISWQILGTHPTNEKMFTMNITKSASNVSNFKSIFWMHPPSLYLESASLSFSNVLIFSITKTWTERVWWGALFLSCIQIYIYICVCMYIDTIIIEVIQPTISIVTDVPWGTLDPYIETNSYIARMLRVYTCILYHILHYYTIYHISVYQSRNFRNFVCPRFRGIWKKD